MRWRNSPRSGELPDAAQLRDVFESHGISDSTTVIVYAHEAPMATRGSPFRRAAARVGADVQ